MVSSDELSIVNTSVRASVRSQSLLLPDAKAAEKGVWKREMKKKERSALRAYLRAMHTYVRMRRVS